MSEWMVESRETITGALIEPLPVVESYDWDRALSLGTTSTVQIPIRASGFTKPQLRDLTAHWKRTITLLHNGKVVASGAVRNRDRQGGMLVLTLVDMFGLLARRGAWDHEATNVELWEVTYASTTLGTLAKRAVQRGTTGAILPTLSLPVSLPADVAGSLTRAYQGFRLERVGEVLSDLMAEGLNIDFQSRLVGGLLDCEMRTDPNENTWEWHVNAAKGGVADFGSKEDGSRMSNHSVLIGEGSGRSMLVRSNPAVTTSDLPHMSHLEIRKNVADPLQAQAMAEANVPLYAEATNSQSFTILASGNPDDPGAPRVEDIRLGDTAHLWFNDDDWEDDGLQERRIVRLSGGMREKVTVTCQPTGGV